MFNFINQIRQSRSLSKQLRREHKRIDEAAARVQRDQEIRNEVMNYLSANDMLKVGIN